MISDEKILIAFFGLLAYIIGVIALVLINPNKVKFEAKKKEDKVEERVAITLDKKEEN